MDIGDNWPLFDENQRPHVDPSKFRFVRWDAPGMWEDDEGALHIDAACILRWLGIPVTRETEAEAIRFCEHALRERMEADPAFRPEISYASP